MRMLKKTTSKLKVAYWSVVGAISALMISVMPTWAAKQPETIWDRFSTIMRDFYGQILAISTIVAVTMAAVALVVRMVSRNQRAVDKNRNHLDYLEFSRSYRCLYSTAYHRRQLHRLVQVKRKEVMIIA